MPREFTDDHRDNDVLTSEGDRIGTISAVDGERATVERDDDSVLPDTLREMLGWDDDDDNEIESHYVEDLNTTGDELRLKQQW